MGALAVIAIAAGCKTLEPTNGGSGTATPEAAALAYATALEQGELEKAHALTLEGARGLVTFEQFAAVYATPAARQKRALEVRASLDDLRAISRDLELVQVDEAWRVAETPLVPGARDTLRRFLDAAEAGDFTTAYGLLASPLRARYTPATLARDYAAEPASKDNLARARLALERSAPTLRGDTIEFPIAEGRAVRLVREGGGYKVAALE